MDQRLRYQQNMTQFEIGVVVVETFDTTVTNLRRFLPEILAAVESVQPGTVAIIATTA